MYESKTKTITYCEQRIIISINNKTSKDLTAVRLFLPCQSRCGITWGSC